MEEFSVKIDDKNDKDDDVQDDDDDDFDSDKPFNGKPTMMEVSPNEKYLVAYNKEDNSILGWSIENHDEGPLKLDINFKLRDIGEGTLYQMCVSDDKKLVYTYGIHKTKLAIHDMMDRDRKITVDCDFTDRCDYCTFNLKGELILYCDPYIYIYPTKTKRNKWKYKRMYEIPLYFMPISISPKDKLYLYSNNSIYEWDLNTEKGVKIFGNDKEINPNLEDELIYSKDNIQISRNENLVCIKIDSKIIVYMIDLEIQVASLDINYDIQLRTFVKHPVLCPLLFPLLLSLFKNKLKGEFWDECKGKSLGHLKQSDQLSKEFFQNYIQVTDDYVFGFPDENLWKIDLKEVISNILNVCSSFKNSDESNNNNSDEIIENWYFDKKETYKSCDRLNLLLFNPYAYPDVIKALFHETISNFEYKNKLEVFGNLKKWKVIINNMGEIELQVFKKLNDINEWKLICKMVEPESIEGQSLVGIKLFDNSNIIILTIWGVFIYHFNENNKFISLIYHYEIYLYDEEGFLRDYKKAFPDPAILPLPNSKSFRSDIWVSSIKNNKELMLKYGVELLKFAIRKRKPELIDEVYEKCITYFKEERNNRMFLSIITSIMPSLNEYYPEYIERYSLDTLMITYSSIYNTKDDELHLDSFQYEMFNLSKSIWWAKYNAFMNQLYKDHKKILWILNVIQILIILPIFPIYFATLYMLMEFDFIIVYDKKVDKYRDIFSSLYFSVYNFFSNYKNSSMIYFTNPYIKFITYPKDYNWFLELIKPQPSPFVETTMNRDIYKTWDGEAIINFKWNTYGKYYYAFIWILFMAFLGCFTIAATTPQQYIDDNIQKQLLVASVILGFIHLIFEIRQIIYDANKWIRDFWNMFDVIAYVLPIYTSIIWLQTNEMNTIPLLSFSCLFLDIKFLLFFRAIEYFGVYFAIIISVAQQIISFLVVLFIIIISFAHAFYILLIPRTPFSFDERTNNNDPNNPWNLASSFNLISEDGSVNPNPYIIQPPNGNTNMFVDFRTSLFAMYKFLTGDSSALSNWTYVDNPALAILIVLFSLLIVVYLMNLLIGLLNNAIEKDNNRVSYLIQKAEILAEIELFYLFPYQRRWETWFPEVIHYSADVDKVREKIKEMIKNNEWDINDESKKNLMKQLNIQHFTNKNTL
ncbi:hypothetical protein RclHR1_16470001 [Rhizophagus clarus]|nr:hypothetical protein RclHR1_16470001 [Rhizophagus clarus]